MISHVLPIHSNLQALTELQESYEVIDIGPNSLFPDATLPEMRANLTQLAEDLKMLGLNLLRCLAGALGLGEKDKEVLVDYHQRILGKRGSTSQYKEGLPYISSFNSNLIRATKCVQDPVFVLPSHPRPSSSWSYSMRGAF